MYRFAQSLGRLARPSDTQRPQDYWLEPTPTKASDFVSPVSTVKIDYTHGPQTAPHAALASLSRVRAPLLFHRLLRHDFRYRVLRVSGRSMKDLHTVLRQKEQDVERVRREIQALLTVIPLLADDQSASDDLMHILRLASAGTVVDNGMADLETYYPFVRHMRVS